MSQSTRRGSTQAPEAGPSTSRRLSRAPVDGDSQQDDDDGERRHTILVKRKLLRQQEREEEDANHIDFGELEEPLPEPEINEEFRNQPLKKEEAVLRLNNLIKEWKEVDRRVTGSLELLANSAGDLQEALANGDDDPAAKEVWLRTHRVACIPCL